MIRLDPLVYAYLKQFFDRLTNLPDEEVQGQISSLKGALSETDDTAALNERDAKAFSDNLQKLLDTLKERQHPFFRPQQSAATSAERDEPPFAELVHYALSRSETVKTFTSSPADLFIKLVLLLPEIRTETSLKNLTLRDVVDFLVSNGKIPAPGEDFSRAVAVHDSFHPAVLTSHFPEIDISEVNTPEKLIRFLINRAPHLLREERLTDIAYQLAMKRNMPDRVNYYLTADAYDLALKRLKTYSLVKINAADLAKILVEAKEYAGRYFPGISISTVNLLFILKSTGRITGSLDSYLSALEIVELYNNSGILKNLGALIDAGSFSHDAALPRLINLLPLIRDEQDDPGLTLREAILAFLHEGPLSRKESPSLLHAAAYFDLYNHPAMTEIKEEDLSSPQRLISKLISSRSTMRAYQRERLFNFISVLRLMGKIDEERAETQGHNALANAYDAAFGVLDNIHDIEEQTSAEILTAMSKAAEEVKRTHPDTEISFLTMAQDLALSGRLTRNIESLLIDASAADLARAWRLSGGLPEVSAEPADAPVAENSPQVSKSGEQAPYTPFLDQFSKEVRPFMETAAARDFVALFERELEEDDLKTPQALVSKIESIRYTLEGYEHEPRTTFVKALEVTGRLPGKAIDYLRLAGAYDLWGGHLNRIENEDLAKPEKLAEKIAAVRSEIEGRENERLATFVEALAVIGKLPGKLKPYTEAATIYDSMLPPTHDDTEGSSTPPVSGGGGGGNGRGPFFHRLPNAASLPVEGVRQFMTPGMSPMFTGAPVSPVYMGSPGFMPIMPGLGIPAVI